MSSSALLHALRSSLCPALTPREAEQIATATVPHRVPAGGKICHEGDPTPGLIFLVQGTAEVLKETPDSGSQLVAVVQAPIMVGEISLLTGQPHTATVRARTDCECHLLTRSQFQRLVDDMHSGAYKLVLAMAGLLARRLAAMNERIIALSQD
jgi:CRP/FNR family transcriptional regulator, cyclic AMP receptor protein